MDGNIHMPFDDLENPGYEGGSYASDKAHRKELFGKDPEKVPMAHDGRDQYVNAPMDPIWDGSKLLVKSAALKVLDAGPLAAKPDKGFWMYENGVWTDGERELSARIVNMLGDQYRTNHETNIRHALWPTVELMGADPHPGFVNFKNGMYSVDTGELLPHSPNYRSTCQLEVNHVDDTDCKYFDAFVKQVVHPDSIDYFWQLFGYLLMPGNHLQKAIFVYGTGANGKGVWFRTIQRIVGKLNVSHVTMEAMADNTFAGSGLYGKLVNICGDVDPGYIEHTGFFKKVTGTDEVRAERKYRDSFDFTPWCVPLFSGNMIPPSSDPTYGYDRRWMVIEFPNTFTPGSDPELETRFNYELPYIALKAIKAYAAIKPAEIPMPESQSALRQEFTFVNNPVARFTHEIVRETKDGKADSPKPEYYIRYRMWCDSECIRPLGRNKFYQRLSAVIGEATKLEGTYRYKGYHLRGLMDE